MSFAAPEYMDAQYMSPDRELNYETHNYEKSREKKLKKLTNEVRRLSQSIHSLKPLDKDWKKMSLNLKRLAEIAFDEAAKSSISQSNYSANTDDPLINTKDNTIESTLWDDADFAISESVVRLILEEGKLNLLLRLLTNFKSVEFKDDLKFRWKRSVTETK